MQRQLMQELKQWKSKAEHLPILLRGARQVGKTHLVEMFGKLCFKNIVSINFEGSPEYVACFDTFNPSEIISKIEILSQQRVIPGETLLFFDEVQACPNAIIALRYFKEKLPLQHVIGAGSLLEFALQEKGMKMPVGRVQYLYLKPLSFIEYLKATDNSGLLDFINNATIETGIPEVMHNKALLLVREYMTIGGMPMVVNNFIKNKSLRTCQEYQTLLLKTYGDDFSKYASTIRHKYLQQVYLRTPGLVGQQIKYVNISPEMKSNFLKEAIQDLSRAGVIFPIYSTSAEGLPFITHIKEKKFKLLFLDIGLLQRASKVGIEQMFNGDLMLLNRGSLAEQFVGQELIAYQEPYSEPELYYWSRDKKSSSAEVDYLINIDSRIIPIEVKAGKTGNLKSLHLLMQEKKLEYGIRLSSQNLHIQNNVLSVPLYMIDQIPRLAKEL